MVPTVRRAVLPFYMTQHKTRRITLQIMGPPEEANTPIRKQFMQDLLSGKKKSEREEETRELRDDDVIVPQNDGELEIAGKKVESAGVLGGEEETTYWTNFIDFKNKSLKERIGKRKKRRHH